MTVDCWWNSTGPAGVIYTVFNHCSSSVPLEPCRLIDVFIHNNNNIEHALSVPCFSCSGCASIIDYYNCFRQCLTDAISRAVVLPTPFCALQITEDVFCSVLGPAHDIQPMRNHRVYILVHRAYTSVDDDHINRAISESFEEARPQRKPATLESIIDMVMDRARLEALEGEINWVPSEHKCAICIDDIEKLSESLTSPCSHVFHETCLVRWLDDNHVCPLLPVRATVRDLII